MSDQNIPKVILPGSEGYWQSYEIGQQLDKLWPDQDADDFVSCVEYNDSGPWTDGVGVTGLLMVKQGERDEDSWIWLVSMSDGSHWWCEGSCDYTGWDCQSGNEWTPFEEAG